VPPKGSGLGVVSGGAPGGRVLPAETVDLSTLDFLVSISCFLVLSLLIFDYSSQKLIVLSLLSLLQYRKRSKGVCRR